jgi:hypothetical protein
VWGTSVLLSLHWGMSEENGSVNIADQEDRGNRKSAISANINYGLSGVSPYRSAQSRSESFSIQNGKANTSLK